MISYQILKSETSVGVNYEEVQGVVLKADFANKADISLKEIRETNYWVRIIIATDNEKMNWTALENELNGLIRILGTIYNKASKNKKSVNTHRETG